ncbi:unnamed protein product [Cyprideis torosa]|uniref:MI domain-containing protein n=1 Tax=Cyprideis torosa TaxID=163714 RepID=A0A7R8WC50_9CRUS|nr:unnamed protein product [Cyprideis torosa]CAG0892839.1 unnamed protein product [Cyprideis torosa]
MAEGEDVPKDFIKSDDAENEADVSDDEEALLAKLSPGQGEAGAIGGGGDGPAQVRGRSGSLGAKKPFGGAGIGGKKRHAKRSNIFLHKQGLTHDHPALNVPRKELRFAKNSRKSRNTFGRGLPKKGGAGGKGVWGRPGRAELQAPPEVDEHDPNYDSDSLDNGNVKLEEVRIQPTDEEVAKMVTSTILEYFEHGETEEAFESLQEQLWDCQSRAFMIPKIALEIAMEHKPSHRELISRLLGDLYGRAFGADDIAKEAIPAAEYLSPLATRAGCSQ